MATALNDANEVVHATRRAALLCKAGIDEIDEKALALVRQFLESQEWIPEYKVDIEPYVISFCARADLALQWLHYGRSARGAAIGFNPEALETKPFDLVQVLYDPAEQDAFLSDILRACFDTLVARADLVDPNELDDLSRVTAHIAPQSSIGGRGAVEGFDL